MRRWTGDAFGVAAAVTEAAEGLLQVAGIASLVVEISGAGVPARALLKPLRRQ